MSHFLGLQIRRKKRQNNARQEKTAKLPHLYVCGAVKTWTDVSINIARTETTRTKAMLNDLGWSVRKHYIWPSETSKALF